MEMITAERLEERARDDMRHALDRIALATSERAKARHIRRLNVAASRMQHARACIRALSAEIVAAARGL